MSRTYFKVNPHSIVAWMSRNLLLEAGAKSEVEVTATGLEPKKVYWEIFFAKFPIDLKKRVFKRLHLYEVDLFT